MDTIFPNLFSIPDGKLSSKCFEYRSGTARKSRLGESARSSTLGDDRSQQSRQLRRSDPQTFGSDQKVAKPGVGQTGAASADGQQISQFRSGTEN